MAIDMVPQIPVNTHLQLARELSASLHANDETGTNVSAIGQLRIVATRAIINIASMARRARPVEVREAAR
jgi:hypothetical protein